MKTNPTDTPTHNLTHSPTHSDTSLQSPSQPQAQSQDQSQAQASYPNPSQAQAKTQHKKWEWTTYAKWILCGEHSVLRGGGALIFPLYSKSMQWSCTALTSKESHATPLPHASQSPPSLKTKPRLQVHYRGLDNSNPMEELALWSLMKKSSQVLKKPLLKLPYVLKIENQIPLGCGLGFSAALCMSMAQWLHHLDYLAEKEIYSFAQNLEDEFHGKSSGMDLAIHLAGHQGIYFQKHTWKKLDFTFTQRENPLFLSWSGKRSFTYECVHQVQKLQEKDPQTLETIDKAMKQSVEIALKALKMSNPKETGTLLKTALQKASHCFEQWGLHFKVQNQIQALYQAGACAVKPTGSGNGGYLLSLWPETPPPPIQQKMGLLPCFERPFSHS